jgi:hypothetical protein
MAWTLHSRWRATAPYRVRIGLALKGVEYDYAPLDLIAGDQRGEPTGGQSAGLARPWTSATATC